VLITVSLLFLTGTEIIPLFLGASDQPVDIRATDRIRASHHVRAVGVRERAERDRDVARGKTIGTTSRIVAPSTYTGTGGPATFDTNVLTRRWEDLLL
jgi:hypothetical protein